MTEIVLFGITGDLARQKLIPALFNIFINGRLGANASFIGFGRKSFTKEEFSRFIEECVKDHAKKQLGKNSGNDNSRSKAFDSSLSDFCSQWSYVCSELTDDSGYIQLASKIKAGYGATPDSSSDAGNCLIYISLPPAFQGQVSKKLIDNEVIFKDPQATRKLAFEKPFGSDAASAKKLQNFLMKNLDPKQVLRIDHYAGKQALAELGAAAKQGIFESSMNSSRVSKIEVRLNETIDVSQRGAFYDSVGAVKDVLQNHVLYMLSVALSLPLKSEYREEIFSLLSIKGKPVLGQYAGYANTAGVKKGTKAETFFDVRLALSNPANVKGSSAKSSKLSGSAKSANSKKEILNAIYKTWKGIEMRLIGGKALSESEASITLHLKEADRAKKTKSAKRAAPSASRSGSKPIKILVNGYGTKEAYETIFEDAIFFNPSRFVSFDQVVRGWEIAESVLSVPCKFVIYPKGSAPEKI